MTDTAPKPDTAKPGYTQVDWDDVSDTPELSEAELADLRPARDMPELFALLPQRGRGRPKRADAKVNLTLRVEPALIEAYKATGPGWQVRMQDALAAGLRSRQASSAEQDFFETQRPTRSLRKVGPNSA
jgi:uncharacterized protein (DUF4415 family)